MLGHFTINDVRKTQNCVGVDSGPKVCTHTTSVNA